MNNIVKIALLLIAVALFLLAGFGVDINDPEVTTAEMVAFGLAAFAGAFLVPPAA